MPHSSDELEADRARACPGIGTDGREGRRGRARSCHPGSHRSLWSAAAPHRPVDRGQESWSDGGKNCDQRKRASIWPQSPTVSSLRKATCSVPGASHRKLSTSSGGRALAKRSCTESYPRSCALEASSLSGSCPFCFVRLKYAAAREKLWKAIVRPTLKTSNRSHAALLH